ncbi:hypothetical protein [Paraburkholderia dinghuensis]|uniref:Uncharacterized protein n=1 Tax=Paraburkholderia dinghuensis TaxID=2305225 RepID=A0A3N6NCE5_9BURK|nr:hypothetical protein [Paraburkholderia dinghuensis]RQH06632.1 hypothetical protein D1Y85_12225 [Paraburkholderia dinghuensis]
MGDYTNRNNSGNGNAGRGASQDFTNRMNDGKGGGGSRSSVRDNDDDDRTSAPYGSKAPRSLGLTKVTKNRPLDAPFRGSARSVSTPATFTVPGARRGRAP